MAKISAQMDSSNVAGNSVGPGDRVKAVCLAERGDADVYFTCAAEVPAHHANAVRFASKPKAVGEGEHPRDWGICRRREGDLERGGDGAHRVDVREVLDSRSPADVLARGPVKPEVAALDEHVARHHEVAVNADDRGVVTRAEQFRVRRWQAGGKGSDERVFADFSDRCHG